jgi:hypothetical protein
VSFVLNVETKVVFGRLHKYTMLALFVVIHYMFRP